LAQAQLQETQAASTMPIDLVALSQLSEEQAKVESE
jgi:hypothetical protein